MIRLLDAGFKRIFKSRIFWIILFIVIGIAVMMIYNSYSDLKEFDEVVKIETLFFNLTTVMGFIVAIFVSLFLGTEYSDGTIRNKIIMGHKRIKIYLSNLILTVFASVLFYIMYLIVISIIGIPIFGGITMSISNLLLIFFDIFVLICAYSSIATFISMICSNIAIATIVNIVLILTMVMVSISSMNILSSPKTVVQSTMVDGAIQMVEVPNPRFPTENERNFHQQVVNVLPTGQSFQIAGQTAEPKILSLYSGGVTIIFMGIGLYLFQRRELK